jgi:hypothetical protein
MPLRLLRIIARHYLKLGLPKRIRTSGQPILGSPLNSPLNGLAIPSMEGLAKSGVTGGVDDLSNRVRGRVEIMGESTASEERGTPPGPQGPPYQRRYREAGV